VRQALQIAVRASAGWQHSREPVVTVLGYHRVAEQGDHLAVSPQTFAQQMAALDEGRDELPVLALHEALDRLADGTAPTKSVVVTFDDAWSDTHENALDVLVEHGIPTTLYVPTAFLDRPGFLTRAQVLDLLQAGIEIGAHTRTHTDLRACSDIQLDNEIAGSRADLEDLLGREVTTFAYPAGLHDDRVVGAVARAGFRTAITTRRGWLRAGSDPLRIRRSIVEGFSVETFLAAARGGLNILRAPDAVRVALLRLSGRDSVRTPV
jgi:peptidoglycan/xylan/chitin deacetylase (PgdA/CDA1 family)